MRPPVAKHSIPIGRKLIGRKPLSGALITVLRKARRLHAIELIVATGVLCISSASQAELPDGFVYLSDIDPSIIQDIRYYGRHNFVGRRIEGYDAPECVLTREAALALSRIQTLLRKKNVSLIVWDCYRPARAVADFMRWSENPAERGMKDEFFPNTAKSSLFARGYISARSAHSGGSTVDLGLAPKGSSPAAFDPAAPPAACAAPQKERFQDGALDMGTGFDCFDSAANIANAKLRGEAPKNRMRLRKAMIAGGFKPYDKEWWHFELRDEPFRRKSFDFPVQPKGH
jgi:D-alanyl-D-alanine dipeptidase